MAKKPKRTKQNLTATMRGKSRVDELKPVLSSNEVDEKKRNRIRHWVTLYRNNISVFIEHYMGVRLFLYQRVMVELMNKSTEYVAICSRASAKSWLVAVFLIAKCILYPGLEVVLASSTKAQAGLIISEKCTALRDAHPNIAREIEYIVTNQNKWEVSFRNRSKIKVVVSGDSARG